MRKLHIWWRARPTNKLAREAARTIGTGYMKWDDLRARGIKKKGDK